jgi:flagellar protein FliT
MNSAYLLERCEQVAKISAWMLAAANEENWQKVDQLKEHADGVIDEVRTLSATVTLTTEERKQKLASMQRILINDGKIREVSQPWLRRVARWLPVAAHANDPCRRMLR